MKFFELNTKFVRFTRTHLVVWALVGGVFSLTLKGEEPTANAVPVDASLEQKQGHDSHYSHGKKGRRHGSNMTAAHPLGLDGASAHEVPAGTTEDLAESGAASKATAADAAVKPGEPQVSRGHASHYSRGKKGRRHGNCYATRQGQSEVNEQEGK